MLLLTRKANESIHIGNDIVVTVKEISRGYVRLGITAPKNIDVHRHEIYLRIQDEKNAHSAD